MRKVFLPILILLFTQAYAQVSGIAPNSNKKRFIERIEVFAGPNLSFNHGNMFIENYRGEYTNDNYVINERKLKPGYLFGLGVYHPLTNKIDLNIRLLYERKGTKNELNTPSNPVNTDARFITLDEYCYNYFTVNASPNFYFGTKKNGRFLWESTLAK